MNHRWRIALNNQIRCLPRRGLNWITSQASNYLKRSINSLPEPLALCASQQLVDLVDLITKLDSKIWGRAGLLEVPMRISQVEQLQGGPAIRETYLARLLM
jgi:hypothetical protein